MTGKHNSHHFEQDLRIEEMLLESGLENSDSLHESLQELHALTTAEAPEPGPELAALLSPQVPSLGSRRWKKRHRTAVISATVIGAMGLGAGAVAAANEDFRETVGHTVGVLFQPSGTIPQESPATESSAPSPTDLPTNRTQDNSATVPAPAGPSAPAGGEATVSPPTGTGPRHPLQPVEPPKIGEAPIVDGKTLPVLPSPAKPSVPGLPTETPGKTGE
ncbi:hypothetical protein [Arthrobacter sp. ISL-30]|uniref:hypothetical protein n=1 Tax=Arthrobacter sp. ISL-30 TaxID=2819109 RepID=UPI001BECE857|nr:hypothetical protein [Arthrobacter sp. ISL-30]MBT2514133.1 hypothetical protein [Arthrobacter sp. ISL-30]